MSLLKNKIWLSTQIVALIVFCLLGSNKAYPALEPSGITIHNEKISADIEGISLIDVLEDIRTKTGIEYSMSEDGANKEIFIKFSSLTLQKGLVRILRDFNSAFIFSSEGKILQVMVNGLKESVSTSTMLNSEPDKLYSSNDRLSKKFQPDFNEKDVVFGRKIQGDQMKVTYSKPHEMSVRYSKSDEMVIKYSPSDKMVVTHDGEKMKVDHNGEGMKIIHNP